MDAFLISTAIAVVIGALVGAGAIAGAFDVRSRQKAAEEQRSNEIWKTLAFLAHAQNARLRVLLAEGQMTEDDKKVADMTVAGLGTVITAGADELLARLRNPVQEPV